MMSKVLVHPREYVRYFASVPSGLFMLAGMLVLLMVGLLALSSATQSFAGEAHFFQRQLMWMGFATLAGVGAVSVEWERLRGLAPWVAMMTVSALLLVFVPGLGVEVKGARRWIDLGFMNVQPSEFAKLGMVFVLAHYLGENQRDLKQFVKGFLIPSAWIGGVSFLILLEPDFGTAFLCGVVGMAMLFLAGARLRYLVPSLLGAGTLFSVAVYLDPVRWARITSFLDVEGNKSDGAYQLWQSILAFGSGGFSGLGLGKGRQQLSFLPEAHTDFILAIIGEEMGLIVTVGIVLIFVGILIIGVGNLRKAPSLFQFALVCGALLLMVLQAFVNVGVVTGCLPTKGMSLPFISYGGSNLVLMFVLGGLMINAFRLWKRPPLKRAREL